MKSRPSIEWHSRGQRFDPAYLHQGYSPEVLILQGFRAFCFSANLQKTEKNGVKNSATFPPVFPQYLASYACAYVEKLVQAQEKPSA